MTCLKYYPLCLLTKTVFCLHFIMHDTTAKKKSLVIFFFSAILRIQLLQFMRYAMKALRCNGFVAGPVSLQLTGHPFAKPHVPCVVSNSKLNFVSVLLPQTSKQWLPLLHLMILPVLPLESESYSLQALLPHLTDRLPRFQS